MPYRVEDSPNARAGCKNAECKNANLKIQKGELRFATQVTIKEHTSWQYRHWGCVTPQVISNLIEETGGETEMVDGFDELSEESQEKVQFALENGHVPDEDWKGDIELNRPGMKGFRLNAKQRATAEKKAAADKGDAPKPKGKRARAKKKDAEDEDEAPAPKKARSKKAAVKEEEEAEEDVEEVEAPKPKRSKKAAPAPKKEEMIDDEEASEPEPPKPKRGKKASANSEAKAAPQKKSGRKRASVNYQEEV